MGAGFSQAVTAEIHSPNVLYSALAYDRYDRSESPTQDYFNLTHNSDGVEQFNMTRGSALVRVRVVPIPPTSWLIGLGLVLIGLVKRKEHT